MKNFLKGYHNYNQLTLSIIRPLVNKCKGKGLLAFRTVAIEEIKNM